MSNTINSAPMDFPGDPRWLNATRGLASSSLIIAAVTVATHADAEDLIALVPTTPLWLPFLWVLIRLMGKTADSQKKGLALAVALGPYPLIFSSFFAATPDFTANIWRVGFATYALLHLLLLVSAVKTYYSMKREPGDHRMLASRLTGGFFVFIFAAILIPHMMPPSRVAIDEASAVTAMRSINKGQSAYAEKHHDKGFAAALSELRQRPGVDSINQELANGRKMHYTFAMIAGPADSRGQITKYTVVARPEKFGKDGWRCFFTDESGVIRYTTEDRPPTVLDAPL
jgi:hypothetical protein